MSSSEAPVSTSSSKTSRWFSLPARASRTRSGNVLALTPSNHSASVASSSAIAADSEALRLLARAASSASLSLRRGLTVAPRMKAWSRGSMLLVRNVAASASVRAITRVEVPRMSACSRAATSRSTCSCAGTRTLPAMCPHFLVPGAWSSKWMPAAPDWIIIFVSFITAVRPPWPVSPSATIGHRKSGRASLCVPLRTAASHDLRSWN
mmetsp:Transcript_28889/g.49351  ORF Transcript_28889/g.49351 Transcript_28889/m.49351 type:complete len:208 (+) Transcript_28889:1034-1657(+)